MVDKDDEQDVELRPVVLDIEVDVVQAAVTPAVQNEVLNKEVRRVRLWTVLGIGAVGYCREKGFVSPRACASSTVRTPPQSIGRHGSDTRDNALARRSWRA